MKKTEIRDECDASPSPGPGRNESDFQNGNLIKEHKSLEFP